MRNLFEGTISLAVIMLAIGPVNDVVAEDEQKLVAQLRTAVAKDYADGVRQIDEALREGQLTDSFVSALLRFKGSGALRSGKFDVAVADLTSALQFDHSDWWSLWQRCWAYMELGFFVPAQLDCEASIEIVEDDLARLATSEDVNPEFYAAAANAYIAYSTLLTRLGEPESGLTLLEKKVKLLQSQKQAQYAEDWVIHNVLAFLEYSARNYESAWEQSSLALADENITDDFAASLYNLQGEIAMDQSRWDRATEAFTKAIDIDAGHLVAMKNMCSLEIFRKDWESAESRCKAVVDLGVRDPALLDALATALIAQRRFSPAKAILEEAFILDPNNITLQAHLALISEYQGSNGSMVSDSDPSLEFMITAEKSRLGLNGNSP